MNRCSDMLAAVGKFVADLIGVPALEQANVELAALHATAIDAFRNLASAAGSVLADPCVDLEHRERIRDAIEESLVMLTFGMPS